MQENGDTVGGRNPAPVDMDKYPVIYKVSCMLGGAGFLPSTVSTHFSCYNDFWFVIQLIANHFYNS